MLVSKFAQQQSGWLAGTSHHPPPPCIWIQLLVSSHTAALKTVISAGKLSFHTLDCRKRGHVFYVITELRGRSGGKRRHACLLPAWPTYPRVSSPQPTNHQTDFLTKFFHLLLDAKRPRQPVKVSTKYKAGSSMSTFKWTTIWFIQMNQYLMQFSLFIPPINPSHNRQVCVPFICPECPFMS